MKKILLTITLLTLCAAVATGCQSASETAKTQKAEKPPKITITKSEKPAPPASGCAPEFQALADNAKVAFTGTGELDIVVITDPLCWHCRLGHKLLGEHPQLYRTAKMSFFPRKSFIGSDMAAWILEDAVGSDNLQALIQYAYTDLKQPKTKDLSEARAIVLFQFVQAFPELLKGTTIEDLAERVQRDNEAHVLRSAQLANNANLPGTPILVAGKQLVIGYGPEAWIQTLEKQDFCE